MLPQGMSWDGEIAFRNNFRNYNMPLIYIEINDSPMIALFYKSVVRSDTE